MNNITNLNLNYVIYFIYYFNLIYYWLYKILHSDFCSKCNPVLANHYIILDISFISTIIYNKTINFVYFLSFYFLQIKICSFNIELKLI